MPLNPVSLPLYEQKTVLGRAIGVPTSIRSNGSPMGLHERTGGSGWGPVSLVNFDYGNPVQSTIGHATTPYGFVPQDHIVRANRDLPFDTPMQYMVMVADRDRSRHAYLERSKRADFVERSTMFNLPNFNFKIARDQPEPNNPEEVLEPGDIWHNYYLAGVCRTETGEQESTGNTSKQNMERNVNNTIAGACRVFDYWSSPEVELNPQTNIGFILKKEDIKGRSFSLTEFDCGRYPEVPGGKKCTDKPFQLVPYACCHSVSPPRKALLYTDEFGQEGLGLWIPLGVVDDLPEHTKFTNNRVGDYARNLNAIVHRPLVDIVASPMNARVIYGHGTRTKGRRDDDDDY